MNPKLWTTALTVSISAISNFTNAAVLDCSLPQYDDNHDFSHWAITFHSPKKSSSSDTYVLKLVDKTWEVKGKIDENKFDVELIQYPSSFPIGTIGKLRGAKDANGKWNITYKSSWRSGEWHNSVNWLSEKKLDCDLHNKIPASKTETFSCEPQYASEDEREKLSFTFTYPAIKLDKNGHVERSTQVNFNGATTKERCSSKLECETTSLQASDYDQTKNKYILKMRKTTPDKWTASAREWDTRNDNWGTRTDFDCTKI